MKKIFNSVIFSKRTFDEAAITIERLSSEGLTQLKCLLRHHGTTVTKVHLTIAGLFRITESDLIQILNFFPSMSEIKLRIWGSSLVLEKSRTEDFLRLFSLKKMDFYGSQAALALFTNLLPRHVLNEFKFSGNQGDSKLWNIFIGTQLAITKLHLDGVFTESEPFSKLQLTHFKIIFRDQFENSHNEFMKTFIKSQSDLKHVDIRCNPGMNTWNIHEKIVGEFSELKSLETFRLNIDNIKKWRIQFFSNFKKLKELEIQAQSYDSATTISKFSLLNMEIEKLIFDTTKLDLSSGTFKQISRNFVHLRSLEVSFTSHHKINFFMKNFPNLDSLKLTYGDAKNIIKFSEVYESDDNVCKKLKTLALKFYEVKVITKDLFFDMRASFPNLEFFEFHSKLPLIEDFLFHLIGTLDKIKFLTLSNFKISNKFNCEYIGDILIMLRLKLKYVKITMRNIQNLTRNSIPIKNLERQESSEERDPNFSYLPLANLLKDHYKVFIDRKGTDKLRRQMELTAGKKY